MAQLGERTLKVCWKDEVKTAVRRKEAVWKEMLAASDEKDV